jgi:hypothetical protein
MIDGQGVLDEAHLSSINEGLAKLDEAERQIKLARQAGVDVGTWPTQVSDTRGKLLAIKQTYFPGR